MILTSCSHSLKPHGSNELDGVGRSGKENSTEEVKHHHREDAEPNHGVLVPTSTVRAGAVDPRGLTSTAISSDWDSEVLRLPRGLSPTGHSPEGGPNHGISRNQAPWIPATHSCLRLLDFPVTVTV